MISLKRSNWCIGIVSQSKPKILQWIKNVIKLMCSIGNKQVDTSLFPFHRTKFPVGHPVYTTNISFPTFTQWNIKTLII